MTVKSEVRAETTGLDGFRAEEPNKGEVIERAAPPVDDDPNAQKPDPVDDKPGRAEQTKPGGADDGDDRLPLPTMSPSDRARAAIADRFSKHRDDLPPERGAGDGDDPPDEGADKDDETQKAPETGPSSLKGDEDPEKLTLVVNGKSVTKTIAEVAQLADLTIDEVKAGPERAIKYARRELATLENVERSKVRRDIPSRTEDDAARPNPKGQQPQDDDNGQPDASRNPTGEVDFVKLAEAIQIEDPKVAGEKLREAMSAVADKRLSQGETSRLVNADRTTVSTATKEFLTENPTVASNKFVQSAMATALYDEYRDDMEEALVKSDGLSPDEAADVLRQASNEQIAKAHQHRRLIGDPHVRPISKELLGKAYARVTEGLGTTRSQTQQQEFTTEREQRKAALPSQPRRASMPPAITPAPKKPITRSSAVAEMKVLRGQGGKPATR